MHTGTVDLWKQLLTRLNQWWKKRKTRQQVSESSKNQQQPQQQQSQHSCGGQVRDGEEEREAATADPDTVEPGMARASEEQQCNNVIKVTKRNHLLIIIVDRNLPWCVESTHNLMMYNYVYIATGAERVYTAWL